MFVATTFIIPLGRQCMLGGQLKCQRETINPRDSWFQEREQW